MATWLKLPPSILELLLAQKSDETLHVMYRPYGNITITAQLQNTQFTTTNYWLYTHTNTQLAQN